MSEFACPGSFECRRICDALAAHGIQEGKLSDEGCQVPSLYSKKGKEIKVNVPEPVDESKRLSPTDLKINSSLFEALTPLIQHGIEENPDLLGVSRVVDGYEDVLHARTELWKAMAEANRAKRQFTDVELAYFKAQITEEQIKLGKIADEFGADILLQGQAMFDHDTLSKYKLVFDEEAIADLDRLAVNAMDGKSTLIIGDKGIAKTQLAIYMAAFIAGDQQPVFLSGHGDQTADEFIGRDRQDAETGKFIFKNGKLIEAMRLGLPVIIDEVNLADQSITMRLQQILLLKPGDKVVIQENGDEEIEIAPGFVVFATANEASERYRHRVVLDPAFRDRFDIITRGYPDADNENAMLGIPSATYRLAFAAASEQDGSISKYISKEDLDLIVRLAHVTQRLYSTPLEDAGVGELDFETNTTQYTSANKPAMTDCITPRTMMSILERCAVGNKIGMDLHTEILKAIRAMDQGGSIVNSTFANKILEFYSAPASV